ncbi:MAG: hypothetical protein SWX82_09530 [Cyanobacteriota bacterium]|nr:hypothetical protein [Cyanobacteriota bacterium]
MNTSLIMLIFRCFFVDKLSGKAEGRRQKAEGRRQKAEGNSDPLSVISYQTGLGRATPP